MVACSYNSLNATNFLRLRGFECDKKIKVNCFFFSFFNLFNLSQRCLEAFCGMFTLRINKCIFSLYESRTTFTSWIFTLEKIKKMCYCIDLSILQTVLELLMVKI